MDRNKEIYKKIASEHGMFAKQVEKIVKSQFKFVLSTMAKPKAANIRLPYIGCIKVHPRRLELYTERQKEYKEKILNDAAPLL